MQHKYSLFIEGGIPLRPGIKRILSILTAFAAVWLSVRFLLPLFFPFVLGTALALAAEPMVGFLNSRFHIPRPISTGIGVSMAFCFLTILALMICAFLVRELRSLAGVLPNLEDTARSGISLLRAWLLDLAARTPQSIQPLLSENVSSFFSNGTDLLDRAVRYVLGLAGNLLSHIPDSALSLFTTVISGFMISAKLPRIKRWLVRRVPKEKLRPVLDALKRMKNAIGGWLAAQVKLVGVTFLLLAVGFLLLRIPYALLWAVGVALVDAFPVLGTGTVLIPWSLICLLQGDGARAIGLLGIYVTVTLIRSVLEPRLLGRHLGLDPLVTLMALYAGYKLWGIGGMILAPLLAVTAIQLVPERKER